MKTRSLSNFLFATCLFATYTALQAQTNTLVVPAEAESAFLNGYIDPLFNPNHVQLIYAPSEFSAAAGDILKITELDFRIDEELGNDIDADFGLLVIRMNVFPGTMEELIARKSGLVAPSEVFGNKFQFRVKKDTSPDFTLRIKLELPFLYDRRRGPLVLEFSHSGNYSKSGSALDCEFLNGESGPDFSRGAIIGPSTTGNGLPKTYPIIVATKFSYEMVSVKISSIQTTGASVSLLLAIDGNPRSFFIEGALSPHGPYARVEPANFSPTSNREIKATLPLSEQIQFYRIVMY